MLSTEKASPVVYAYEKKCEELGVRANKLVKEVIADTELVDLSMELVYLGAKGVLALVSVIRLLRSLQTISLKNCQLTNEAVVTLANVCKVHPTVSKLNLSSNNITLPAAKALLDLSTDNPNIVDVQLENTDISDNYIQRINLQVEQNASRSQPNKENVLIDEESRLEHLDTEEWEWNSNYRDQEMEERRLERDREEDKKGQQALPFDPDVESAVLVSQVTNGAVGNRRPSLDGQLNVLLQAPVLPSQSVTDILKQLVEKNLLWTDPHFPPEPPSIWTKLSRRHLLRYTRRVVWRRAREVVPDGTLFGPDAVAAPPVQGNLADSWLISAMGIVYKYPSLISRLFLASYPELGVYHVQVCKSGQWMEVVIDDWLPCDSEDPTKLLFGKCNDSNQLWCSLLEKAYAKLHGGYDRIALGSTSHALEDLTGGLCSTITLSTLTRAKELVNSGVLWDKLRNSLLEGGIVGAISRVQGECKELATGIVNGIAPNRAYSVLDLTTVNNWEVVKLHDPWRMAVWEGKFSMNSTEMTDKVKEELGYTQQEYDNGFIWLTFEDFATFFNKYYTCNIFGDKLSTNILKHKPSTNTPSTIGVDVSRWHCVRTIGEWYGRSAGGKFREQGWTENPQYIVRVRERNTRVFIALNQFDARLNKDEHNVTYPLEIGFYVIITQKPGVKKKHYTGKKDTIYSARFVKSRQVCTEVRLQPDQWYLIIPCTKVPGQETKFGLTLWSPSAVTCSAIDDQSHEYKAKGWWRRNTAGGRMTGFETWVNNPQFVLRMKQSAPVCMTLHQDQKVDEETGLALPLHHIAYYVFKGSTAIAQYEPKQVVAFTDFVPYKTVFQTLDLEQGDYIVIPMTWTKGQEATFEITVYTTAMVSLSKIQRVVEKTAL